MEIMAVCSDAPECCNDTGNHVCPTTNALLVIEPTTKVMFGIIKVQNKRPSAQRQFVQLQNTGEDRQDNVGSA